MAVLALLFIVVPLVELYVIIQVGQSIGALNVIGLLIVMSIAGGWLMKQQGLGVLRRVQDQLHDGQVPGREIVDGFLILFGGALMLTPGFLTDVLGIALLLPPFRAIVRAGLARRFRVIAVNRGGLGDVIDL
ncbi:MAG TPA: FxsA family protein [Acidimicrobiales bacterium]|nr:FxsA family protein [Acidimicrobiales bacterium]